MIDCATRARQILEENLEKLHALARALLERESLDGEEIARILRARPFRKRRRRRSARRGPRRPAEPPPAARIAPAQPARARVAAGGWRYRAACRAGAAPCVLGGVRARRAALPVVVMGVLNVSPESFYAGSVHRELDDARAGRARRWSRAGAAILDVGARVDGAVPRDRDRRRGGGAIGWRGGRGAWPRKLAVPVSADTARAAPARAALDAGARIVNDVHRALGTPRWRALCASAARGDR